MQLCLWVKLRSVGTVCLGPEAELVGAAVGIRLLSTGTAVKVPVVESGG